MKKIILVLILSLLVLSMSGCTDEVADESPADSDTPADNVSDSADVMPGDSANSDVQAADNVSDSVDTINDSAVIADLIPEDDIPENFELLGIRNLTAEDVGDDYVSIDGTLGGLEGLYMYMDSTDLYIDIIETSSNESAENFITMYKAEFKSLAVGDRFTNVSVNGHAAVRILEYATVGTEHVGRYTYIWNNGKFVFVVSGATENTDVLLALAESTGY
ncbi:hypothetical protein [uncultured Methanolobus sp.]|uniref:hypothetical protein n=1 Tax=uncultured Methanolobus sp. TaxID=218300 RepID=UPI002AABCA44|nr:hypothetical protein [uncultured Methanolobus sp.]